MVVGFGQVNCFVYVSLLIIFCSSFLKYGHQEVRLILQEIGHRNLLSMIRINQQLKDYEMEVLEGWIEGMEVYDDRNLDD